MRRVDSYEDEMRDIATYEFDDGTRVSLSARAVREYGADAMLRDSGYAHLLPTERLPVKQRGRVIGTVPAAFDPLAAKSKSFFYDFRRGDFVREGEGWTAANNIGPGDFEAVPGFVWEPGAPPSPFKIEGHP